ncbi:hypothetical protein KMT30_04565 [Streptomyces sp. IBSBF 2953]|uniref:hypothetical protein n=1 Tax=Streptomyces TaxID=1883 RepID=UPI00211A2950|nr:hypothetical protein [Streptomyces hayashii]
MTHRGNVAGIHDAVVDFADELKRRNDLTDDDLADVPRLIVAMDSANITLRQIASYLETLPGERPEDVLGRHPYVRLKLAPRLAIKRPKRAGAPDKTIFAEQYLIRSAFDAAKACPATGRGLRVGHGTGLGGW